MTKRHLFALPILALLLVPAFAQAQTHKSSSAGSDGALRLGVLLGPEFASGDTGIAVRGDVEMGLSHLSPAVRLDGVFSLGYTHFSYGRFDDTTVNLVRLVPAARFVFPVAPAVTLYADAGLGLYLGSASYGGTVLNKSSDSLFGFNMRFAGGAGFDINPTVRFVGELGVNPYFGDVDDTTTTLMLGVQFRL